MPAILTENLFISCFDDAKKLKDEKFLNDLADIYCQGIAEALYGINVVSNCNNKEGKEDMEKISITIPDWANEAIEWALGAGLITTEEGSEDFYRLITILYRYHNKFND
jgi:hypothetical protein